MSASSVRHPISNGTRTRADALLGEDTRARCTIVCACPATGSRLDRRDADPAVVVTVLVEVASATADQHSQIDAEQPGSKEVHAHEYAAEVTNSVPLDDAFLQLCVTTRKDSGRSRDVMTPASGTRWPGVPHRSVCRVLPWSRVC
jgi:hypothetical protein